jgi:nitrogen regulatory protein P-II 1
MKEIKAFIHRNRVGDVIHALKEAGFSDANCHLSVIDVKGMLEALDSQERDYSLELGEAVITEVKLELVCADERADEAVQLIHDNARTGQARAGWVFITDINVGYAINGG